MRIAALNSASRIKNVRAQANHTATPPNKRHSRVSGFEGWYYRCENKVHGLSSPFPRLRGEVKAVPPGGSPSAGQLPPYGTLILSRPLFPFEGDRIHDHLCPHSAAGCTARRYFGS